VIGIVTDDPTIVALVWDTESLRYHNRSGFVSTEERGEDGLLGAFVCVFPGERFGYDGIQPERKDYCQLRTVAICGVDLRHVHVYSVIEGKVEQDPD
jgi:hypothetical protein